MNKPVELNKSDKQSQVQAAFDRLKNEVLRKPMISYRERIDTLTKIEEILQENDEAICEAICRDFGNRAFQETKILEIAPSIMGIRYTKKRLKKWMKPQNRDVSLVFFGGKNRVIPQAKGIVGIVAPWNYPLFLVLSPLTSAIAAGNRVMVKQATNSQNLCRLLQEKFSEKISKDLITILPGVSAGEFSSLPFNHLIFTGSPDVGKTVMRTASNNLVPVTLELGGKSPTILAEDFDLQKAVKRIMFAKLMNSGQTCVAPDYLFLPEGKEEAFIEMAKTVTRDYFKDLENPSYTSVIDERAFNRLTETLADAEEKGANLISLLPNSRFDKTSQKISPTLLINVNKEMIILQEEIFGPLLPIMTYRSLDEVIEYVNHRERPLALYVFSNNKTFLNRLIENTRSGGVTINDCAMHVAQHDLPFGGIGNSGMGHYHGFEGFCEFSKLRPVFKQARNPVAITPPYGKTFNRIYGMIKRMKMIN